MAQTDAEYEAAMAAIEDGGVYRIFTSAPGAMYYINADGALVPKDQGEYFTFTKKTGGGLKTVGVQVSSSTKRFTNAAQSNNKAVLNCGKFSTTTGDRADWESQVFFLKEGKYAIRACNVAYGESGWADCGRVFFDFAVANADASIAAKYNYEPTYIWEIEGPLTVIDVTYKLVESDGTTVVSTVTKKQEANSKVNVPTSMTSNFLYNYDVEGAIGEENCTITITRIMKKGTAHSLTDLSNAKTYNIGCERGVFLTKNNYLASTAHSSLNAAEPTEFAVISYEDNYYLYSVADKMFVTNTGALSEMPVKGVNDAVVMTPKTDPLFLYTFKINESTQYGLNTNGNDPYGYVINSWVNADAGNQYFMIEVADFDPADALAALNDFFHPTYFVTYVVKDEAGNELFKSEALPTRKGAKITTIPAEYQLPFTKYSEADVTISETETVVEFTASWDGPFQVTTDVNNPKWYNMTIRSDYSVFVGAEEPYYPKASKDLQKIADEYQWAFAGNAYTGIMVFNKAKGVEYTLTKDGDAAVMREGKYVWTIGKNGDGFTLKEPKTDYNCINQNGGNTGPLSFWNSAGSLGDNGSTFRISAVPTSFEWTIGEAGYSTMYLPYSVNVVGNSTIPTATGAWTFDNGSTDGTGIATLSATEGVTFADGAAVVPANDYLKMTTNANGDLTTYTFMMDVKIANENKGKYTALYQNKPANDGDGSLFFLNDKNKGRGVGLNYCDMGYGANGSVELDKMYRVVFVCKDGVGAVYLNGVLAAKATKSCTTQSQDHWTMRASALFFVDNDGEDNDIVCDELRFWDVALTADQVAELGANGTSVPGLNNVEASVATLNGDYMKLNKLDAIVPAATPVVLKAEPGTYKFCVDNSLLNCAKAVEKTNALDDNTITEEDYSVVGYITNTDGKISKDQQVFWMADEVDGGKVFEAYWANIPDPTTPLVVGQKVIITGKLQKYVNKSGVVTCEIKNPSVAVIDNDLRGTYEEIDAEGQYVLAKPEGKEVGFYRATSGKIAAYKAYLTLFLNEGTEAKEAFLFNATEDATAIESLTPATTEGDGAIYNIAGQRVNKAQKGIYIVNGKKVLF